MKDSGEEKHKIKGEQKMILKKSIIQIAFLCLALLTLTGTAWAEEKPSKDMHALAKASQNPISTLISVPFENNATFNNGTEDVFVNILNIKPVIPMALSKNWNLVNRAIVPVVYQEDSPNGIPGDSSVFGVGDIVYQGFFSPAKPGKFIWGVGPQLNIPTGMDRLTSDRWAAGPAVVALVMPGHWVIGALASNVFSFGAGYNDAGDVNELTFQYFINYNMKGGWYLSTAPVITADWEADSGNEWTVPVGGGLGRVFKIGEQHVNMKGAVYYNVESPDDATDWNLQLTCTFLFPK